MALLNATSLAGFVLLFYLSSFVVFAVLRIATGVSIQRVGYFSLRHIAYTPKEGIRLEIRGLGLSLHRPNFAQPTWISLRITELKVVIDPVLLKSAPKSPAGGAKGGSAATGAEQAETHRAGSNQYQQTSLDEKDRSQLWKQLTNVKEKIKRIHRKIHWLCMLDIIALNTAVEVVGVGHVQIANFTMAVDTRRKMVDRGRLFRHKKDPSGNQRPAEWIFTVKSIFLSVGDNETVEILDVLSVNIHGILYTDREGLRDTSIAVRGGRLHIAYDDIHHFARRMKEFSPPSPTSNEPQGPEEITFTDVVEELDRPGSREAKIVRAVSDSKEFVGSILQNVQEIQWAMTFVGFSKIVDSSQQASSPLVLNVVTHEIGIDLHRVDSNSPAHRMYFSRGDIAHQALVAAISISASLDEGENAPNKIMYIPMATTTIRTTLPAKTMTFTEERNVSERNANVLFANLVVTSPSIDLEPRHLVQLLAIQQKSGAKSTSTSNSHRLISRLLPRASVKFSIHEPVVRFVLPVAHPTNSQPDDFDMIISAVSSVALEVESSHSDTGELRYSLASNFRISSHQLYYQAASGIKHNLVVMDSLEIKLQLSTTSEVRVILSGNLRSFSILMVREEVSTGVYNIVRHFKRSAKADKLPAPVDDRFHSFLRKLPSWLLECHLEGSDCSIEIGGIDKNISNQTRGIALQLESWTADYLSQRVDHERRPSRGRPSLPRSDDAVMDVKQIPHPRKQSQDPSDGRRLAAHVRGLEGFIIQALDSWEHDPFLSLPRFEIAMSTSRDLQGPIFHVTSAVRAFYMDFSLYRYYSIGVGVSILKDAFMGPVKDKATYVSEEKGPTHSIGAHDGHPGHETSIAGGELVAVDAKVGLVQIKATMPSDPPVLLQVFEAVAGRHRWSAPFLRSHLIRLHAEAPRLRRVWARLVSMNNVRVDIRHSKKKTAHGLVDERSLDLSTDFIRLAVPHGLKMYKVFDNFVNTAKSVAQLHHRFKTRSNEYILKKPPVSPKHVPRISLRSKALMFELEDDPFEWKLNAIYHIGLVEQKQRIARAEAFSVKLRKLQDERKRRSPSQPRYHTSSPGRTGRHERDGQDRARSKSHDNHGRKRSISRGRTGKASQKLRYDPQGVCSLTGSAKVEAAEAWEKLEEHNARSWKRRIDSVLALQNDAVKNIRRMFSGADEPPHDIGEDETILAIPNRPGMMTTVISDLHLVVDKPSFPPSECSQFIHQIGKGMPYDMKYSVLVPLHFSLDMGEARVMLRDYPLNLLHIPAIRAGQPPRLPSWSLKTDFVVAEEYRDDQSTRHVKVDIVPKGQHDPDGVEIPGFSLDVRRTVAPVKTYSKPAIEINTSLPTAISWGTSYQPVIQDMMMTIEGFTKPEIDPSDRVGFWDKIRMILHSRLTINWKGDGDLQLRLKGSRDPYVVTGYGAGFVMCWRNDVQWAIHTSDDPKKFMTVTSGEYVLAVPDYSHQARALPEHRNPHETDSISTASSKNAATFKKVIMKLSGNVQWLAGLVFERDLENGERTSSFEPHYGIILRNPKHMEKWQLENYDAFRGFRSHHIHLSIAVAAPYDRDWASGYALPANGYNSVHLSPRFFSHFYSWWSLFSGIMSLPIRQGNLWSGPAKSSKKFGRHLATIKYNLLLSPLFLAHIYKHKDAEDYAEDTVSATGLKIRLDSFVLDLHQRREYFDTQAKGKSKQTRTSGMRINQAELDFISADVRAVSANIGGTTADDLLQASEEALASYQDAAPTVDMSQFTIPDQNLSWIDMDDFVELDWILPSESNPETKILPLAFTPRFTYFRQTDHGDSVPGDQSRTSPFGDEPTHYCVMSQLNDPQKVQMELVRARLESLEEQIELHQRLMAEQELHAVRDGDQDKTLKDARDNMIAQEAELHHKKRFLENGLRRLAGPLPNERVFGRQQTTEPQTTVPQSENASSADVSSSHPDMDALFPSPQDEFTSDFNNRFNVHNIQLKWNNALRNIILRYSHQVSQRRGFVYYMSRRAVKFIIDIVEEQTKSKTKERHHKPERPRSNIASTLSSPSDEKDEDNVVQDRIMQLLNDAKRFVDVEDLAESEAQSLQRESTADIQEQVAEDFVALNSYQVRLIAPQIQLQSEKNTRSVVLVSAKGMDFKVISIMDRGNLSDDVSGLVQRRFALDMDGAQFFVTTQKTLYKFLHLYSGNKYGNAPGSSWPPWVSLEVMFDFHLNPFGFQRIIQKTSASLRYEKYNPLRLKHEKVESGENASSQGADQQQSRLDQLWIDFPRVRASCDSTQYYAMYVIVMDLLLYSEPLEKTRSERLDRIMLASDFSDLRGAPEIATSLQERIRQLEEIKNHFQINARYLDRDGWQDRIKVEEDLSTCENELFFIMKAITTSQQKNDDRKSSKATGLHRWYLSASEIVWHLMRDKNEPLLEFQLGNAAYERVDNRDGSNRNAMEIQHIRGLNLLPNALYPDIIGPYHDPDQVDRPAGQDHTMVQVHWYMLEAIAGIPVLEEFQVKMFPVKVQLERDLGKKLFEYIFPGVGSNPDGGVLSPMNVKNMKPVEDEEDSEVEEAQNALSPALSHGNASQEDLHGVSIGALGRRLRPTLALQHHDRLTRSASGTNLRGKGLGLSIFKHPNPSVGSRAVGEPSPSRKSSYDNLQVPKKNADRVNGYDHKKKLGIHRASSKDRWGKAKKDNKNKPSDDLSMMMSRASNYMTLAHVKLDSFVICLSYKGKGDRNIEDLHDFVLRLPTLEYRNKTWSNLDLALRLKKDVIKALISHTGAILGNKFTHHRANKQQQNRLREIAANSAILPNSDTLINTPATSETASLYSNTNYEQSDLSLPRGSISAGNGYSTPLIRSNSFSSSGHSTAPSTFREANVPPPGEPIGTSISTLHSRLHGGLLHSSLSRHFTHDSSKSRSQSTDDTDAEIHRRKSVMLLGKKILGSLT